MMKKLEVKLDLGKYESMLHNRIIYGADLETYIISNFTTNMEKLGILYETVMERALDYLVGIEAKKHKIQLFELIQENDFNSRYMEIIAWLSWKINVVCGPFYQEVNVKSKDGSILTLEVIKEVTDE